MKKLFAIMAVLAATAAHADEHQFTAASLNVDGLPASIATVNINPDGPGSAGTTLMSQVLASKGYDILAVSEDFNFDSELMSSLSGTYNCGKWRGKIAPSAIQALQILSQSWRADTDGLNLIWKKSLNVSGEAWTIWNKWNGYTNDGADGLIRKGFRYYCVEVAPGAEVDVYILHMDAETTPADNAARADQINQLITAIKATDNKRPIIIMGDTNCRYTRDYLERDFIGALNADSRFTANDCWIQKCFGGFFPAFGSDALMVNTLGYVKGEIVDKIFYVNNTESKYQLRLDAFKVDTEFDKADGTPLSDHYPVVAQFTISDTYNPAEAESDPVPSEVLDGATADSPVDGTTLIKNPGFEYGTAAWTSTNTAVSLAANGTPENSNVERYYQDTPADSKWEVSQTLTNLPSGIYKVQVQGFYRGGWNNEDPNPSEPVYAYLFANDERQPLHSVYDETEPSALYSNPGDGLSDFKTRYGYVPNGQVGASAYFTKGHYEVELTVEVTDGTLRLGIAKDAGGPNPAWVCFDNFRLTYYGEKVVPVIPQYTVTFMLDGEVLSAESYEGDANVAVVVPDVVEREGYTFVWDAEIPEVLTEDVVITGSYIINKYQVTFVIDGETVESTELDYGSAVVPPVAPEREGYTFGGWQDVPETVPANDVTVTGSYTVNQYTVTFVIGDEVIETQTLDYGSPITSPEAPEVDGFFFDGWDDVPSSVPAGDIIITGSYSEIIPEIAQR